MKNDTLTKKNRARCATLLSLLFLLLATGASTAEPVLRVEAAYPTLPLMQGVSQEISIELTGDDLENGQSFDLFLSAESGYGALHLGVGSSQAGGVVVRAGEPVTIQYRWIGPIPTESAYCERIIASVPALSVSKNVEFSVGVDLRIADVLLPERIPSGQATGIEVVLHDAFDPDNDVTPLLVRLGVKPELALSLRKESPATFAVSEHDPVAEKFFGRNRPWQLVTTYPGPAFLEGVLGKDIESRHIWRDIDRELPTITPPSGGEYRLYATLRTPTGGVALREFRTTRFEVEQTMDITDGLPPLMASTIRILSALDAAQAARAADNVRKSIEQGKPNEAIVSLGTYMQNVARNDAHDKSGMLGRYTQALTASIARTDEIAEFLRHFLRGYGDCGVLLATKNGIGDWSAQDASHSLYAHAPQGTAYDDGRFLVLPFRLGDDFTLRMKSAKGTSTWKILPAGVEKKNYAPASGRISAYIRTDRLSSETNRLY
ncbi:hypothetical protein LJC31_06635 [Synergistaceae bacterium OttesenSCG-928-I11]|nr:hypothetical protein [Synergistaceae bacterium OttesenSCG-928-I11]